MNDDVRPQRHPVNRRGFLATGLGATAAALSSGALFSPRALAQTTESIRKGEHDRSAQNPGPMNGPLHTQNPSSDLPPVEDSGDVAPFWYSFDLSHRRVQEGGWTRQVTQADLPISRDVASVNMRLTAGSYRELHWHTANEWAYMLYGGARITVLDPDGGIFIDDVAEGDLWYFPAGLPHSLQGLGPDGCEFLLVFDDASFSEYRTFLLSDWLAHTPREVLRKNLKLSEAALDKLPQEEEYIFPGTLPGPLADDRAAVGGPAAASKVNYTFRMKSMPPIATGPYSGARVVDSSNFPIAKAIASALITIKPGGLRELHWHPNASEWQYYIQGSARMTVFASSGKARTMNFNANDVGFVPAVAGHYIENLGTDDVVVLALFKSAFYSDISLNRWLRRLPAGLVQEHLLLSADEVKGIGG